jgi:hypothetical protein
VVNRERFLAVHSLAIGDAWVEHVKLDLRHENREVAGGWPGTLREARARAYAHFTDDATIGQHAVLTRDELESAVRAVYERARARWLASARTDNEENA